MTLHYTIESSSGLKKKRPAFGGLFFFVCRVAEKKLCALLSGLALLRDLLGCLLCGLLYCLLYCLLCFLLCGHGGCELEMVASKSTRSCVK